MAGTNSTDSGNNTNWGFNTAPVATADSYSTNEDTPLTVSASGVLSNDTDGESNPLTAVLVSNVSNGSLTLNSDGSFTYTPTANWSGSDSFAYNANDGTVNSASPATVTITVNAVNDTPTTTGISNVTVNEDSANTVINMLTSFSDTEDGTGLTYSVQSNTNPGLASAAVSGGNLTLSYTANGNGSANITVRGTDSGGFYAETAFTVTVNAVNDNPATTGISNITVNEDSANTVINMLTSFSDTEDGTGLTYSVQSNTNPGLVSAAVSGGNLTLSYTANGNGSANITVRGTDSGGLYAETAFTVTVNAGDDNPTTSGISNITVNEDSANTVINMLTSFSDTEDGTGLTYSVQSNTNPGLVSAAVSGGNLTLSYTANGNGSANITVRGTDTGGLYAETAFTVTVNAGDDNPTTSGISNITVNEDSANTVINLLTSFNDTEDGTGLTYTVQSNTNSGLVNASISGGNLTLSFTANGNGTANITVRGTDSGGLYAETAFTVTVNAVNDNPATTGISNITVNEDSANTVINLLTSFNDIEDGTGLVYSVQANTNPGLVSAAVSGGNLTLSYTANGNGSANITVRGTDSGGLFAETTFTVTVNAGDDNPATTGISNVTVNEDSPNTVINLLTSFSDIEDGSAGLVYSVQSNTNTGLVSTGISGGNLTLSYTANVNGSANITVRGTDTGGLFAETTFTVTVNAGDDNPTTSGISNITVNEDSANTVINLLTSFNDVEDGTGLTYSVQSNTNTGLVSTSISGGNLTLSFTANANGTANITVRGTDSGGLYAEAAFTVTVNAVNDTPVISSILNQSIEEDTSTPLINFTVSDPETPAENLILSAVSSDTCTGSGQQYRIRRIRNKPDTDSYAAS